MMKKKLQIVLITVLSKNLKSWLRRATSAPVFEDEEKTRRAKLLNAIVWTFFAISLSGGLALLFVQGFGVRFGMAVTILVGLGAVYTLMRRGYIQLANLVLVLVLSLTTTITLYRLGGLRFPGVSLYILITLIAGLLLDVWLSLAMLGLLILAILGLYYAELAGFISYTIANEPLPVVLVATIVILAFTAVLIYLYSSQVKQALERARRNERALAENNRILKQEITERHQAEEILQKVNAELQQTQALLRVLIDNVPAAILVRDIAGRYSLANRQAATWSGYSVEQIVGRLPQELFPLEVRGAPKPVAPDTKPMQREFIWPGPDKTRLCHQYRFPIFGDDKSFYGICIFVLDITQQKEAEAALARRAAEMTALYETSLEMDAALDLSTLLTVIVRRAANLLGVEMGTLLLSNPDRETLQIVAVHNRPDSDIGITVKTGQGLTGRVAQTHEPLAIADYRHWPGRIVHFAYEQVGRILAVPLKQGQQVIGVLNVFDSHPGEFDEDDVQLLSLFAAYAAITVQNARLLEAEQHHREMAETLSEIARVTNASLELNEVLNQILLGLKKVLAYETATIFLVEAEGFRIAATSEDKEQQRLVGATWPMTQLRFMEHVFQTRRPQLVPDTSQVKHFSPATQESALSRSLIGIPLISQEEVIGVVGIGSYSPNQYTEEDAQIALRFAQEVAMAINNAKLYQQIQRYNQELEEMVAARTRELEATQERLIRQEKLAFLGQLAGGVGHELRNPLGVINNAIYFLQSVLTEADETVKEYLELIANRVEEADKIVADLLNLSRNRTADRVKATARQLIDEALARQPAPDGVTVTLDLPPDLPALFVDPQQIRQVLVNLVANAYQAMPHSGELAITARLASGGAEEQGSGGESVISPLPPRPLAPPHNYVVLTIADTGHGMSPEVMEKIFEPLYSTKPKGIGLGLAVSRNLVEVNGGRIEVESIEGQGTTFTVTLPKFAN